MKKRLGKFFSKTKNFIVRNAPTLSGAEVAVGTGVMTATAMALASAGSIPLAVAVGTWTAFCVITQGITITQAEAAKEPNYTW